MTVLLIVLVVIPSLLIICFYKHILKWLKKRLGSRRSKGRGPKKVSYHRAKGRADSVVLIEPTGQPKVGGHGEYVEEERRESDVTDRGTSSQDEGPLLEMARRKKRVLKSPSKKSTPKRKTGAEDRRSGE